MKHYHIWAPYAVFAAVALLGYRYVAPNPARLLQPECRATEDVDFGETYVRECQARMEGSLERDRLALEVIDEKLTLLEAAAQFRDLNRSWNASAWTGFREIVPGDSDEERYCRQVINYVRTLLERDRSRDTAIVDQLESELEELLKVGRLWLPGDEPGWAL